MAMEIVRTVSFAQKNAEQSLLKLLSNALPQQARIQMVSKLPSGETQIQLNAGGQTLDLKVDAQSAAQMKPGTLVLLQTIQTQQGPRLAISLLSPDQTAQTQMATATKGNATSPPTGSPNAQPNPIPKVGAEPAVLTRPLIPAQTGNTPVTPQAPYGASPSNPSPAAQPQQASGNTQPQESLVALQRQALSQQRSLADLFANLTAFIQQVETGQRPKVSPDIETAMRWLLGFQLTPKQPPEAAKAKTALKDIMTSLGLLGQLSTGQGAEKLNTNLKASLNLLQALLPKDANPPPPPASGAQRDHPPLPNIPLQGQSPRPSNISPADPNSLVLARIKSDVDAALARLTLNQIASARSAFSSGASAGSHSMQTLHVEIPVMLANGTAIVQMTLEHEPDAPDNEAQEQDDSDADKKRRGGWTVHFAMDADAIGPVDVSLRLHQQSALITLAAEQDQTVALFEQAAPTLQAMLEEEGLTLEGLSFSRKKDAETAPAKADSPPHHARLDRKL